jgi:hypothetical protein
MAKRSMENADLFEIRDRQFSYDKDATAAIESEIENDNSLLLTDDDLIEIDDEKTKVIYVNRTIPIFRDNLLKFYDPDKNKLDPKYTDDFWFVGRDQILAFCKEKFNFGAWNTVNHWCNFYAFPIRKLPNGEPFLIYIEAINWALTYDNLMKAAKREQRLKGLDIVMVKYGAAC